MTVTSAQYKHSLSLSLKMHSNETGVTTGRVWIGNQIYWTLQHTTHDYTLQITITIALSHNLHQFSGNSFQRQTFPFLWVPELSPCFSHSNLTDSPANSHQHQLTLFNDTLYTSVNCPAYNIVAWTHGKHLSKQIFYCWLLFSETIACLLVIVQQWAFAGFSHFTPP
jgi:hypothetical protein